MQGVYADIVTQPFGICASSALATKCQSPATELRRMKSEIDLAFRRLVAGRAEGSLSARATRKMTAFVIAGALELDRPLVPERRRIQRRPGGRAVHRHADARRAGHRAQAF